jgi:hypothetical protein
MRQTVATKPEERKPATLEDVWTVIREIGEQHKELEEIQKETEKKFQELAESHKELAESHKELAKSHKELTESHKETEKLVKELSDNVGGVNNSLGDMAEGLMASDLYEKFDAFGLEFDNSIPNYELKEKKTKRKLAEVDMLLVNGTVAMAVEVKTHMTQGDVNKHVKRMAILRREPNSLFVNRTLYGAMASVKASKVARNYAIDKGFFVIDLTGDLVKIDMPTDFKPKTW